MWTPWGSETPEQISIKLGIYNYVVGVTTHANPCGAATTWVLCSYALLGAQLSWLPARVECVLFISMHCGISQASGERSASDARLYEHAHITPNCHMLILPVTSLRYWMACCVFLDAEKLQMSSFATPCYNNWEIFHDIFHGKNSHEILHLFGDASQ